MKTWLLIVARRREADAAICVFTPSDSILRRRREKCVCAKGLFNLVRQSWAILWLMLVSFDTILLHVHDRSPKLDYIKSRDEI